LSEAPVRSALVRFPLSILSPGFLLLLYASQPSLLRRIPTLRFPLDRWIGSNRRIVYGLSG